MWVLIRATGHVSLDLALLLQFIELLDIREEITCAKVVLIVSKFSFLIYCSVQKG
jgi:hypothetical protein